MGDGDGGDNKGEWEDTKVGGTAVVYRNLKMVYLRRKEIGEVLSGNFLYR